METKLGLEAQLIPSSVSEKTLQRTMFPVDAFSMEDAHSNASPVISLQDTWRSDLEYYNSSAVYATNDIVFYLGSVYYSLQDSNSGNTPSLTSAYWRKITDSYYTVNAVSSDTVLSNTTGHHVYVVSPSTATVKMTLPEISSSCNVIYTFIKGNSNYGPVMIDPSGTDTISGLDFVFLWKHHDTIQLISDGSEWFIVNDFKPYYRSGLIPVSDKTNIHYGNVRLVIDNVSGTIVVGDKCTGGTDGSYGIVVDTDNSTYVELMELVDGSGAGNIFTNNKTLAFDLSSATADVNMASHAKNQDYYMFHGWGRNIIDLDLKIYVSADGTVNNYIDITGNTGIGGDAGINNHQYDSNNVFPQLGTSSYIYVDDSGTSSGGWTHYQCCVRMK